MALKHATFFTYGNDSLCAETKKFIEEAGIVVDIRDIEKKPFTYDELDKLIGHMDSRHFLNPFSDTFSKYNLDEVRLPREELVKLMTMDHTLIRRPIVKTARLMTVGCDKKKIAEMLQISSSGNGGDVDEMKGNLRHNNGRNNPRRSNGRSEPSAPETTVSSK